MQVSFNNNKNNDIKSLKLKLWLSISFHLIYPKRLKDVTAHPAGKI